MQSFYRAKKWNDEKKNIKNRNHTNDNIYKERGNNLAKVEIVNNRNVESSIKNYQTKHSKKD